MRDLAYIQKIKSLSPIPGADKIEKAEVLGWEVIVKKNEFKPGDLIIYCEIDSILPELPPFEFLRPRKFRIKTIKLRNQISQGIIFPLSVLKEVDSYFDISKVKIGNDVTEILKIIKHDPEADLDIKDPPVKKTWIEKKISYYKWKLFGFKPTKSENFPKDVPKTDETRVQKMGSLLRDKAGGCVYITEKVEGTSSTFVFKRVGNWFSKLVGNNYSFQVCSRNRIIFNSQKGGDSTHPIMQVAKQLNLQNKMKKLNRNLAIQGEVIGPKIQGNIYRLPQVDLRVFLIYDLDTQRYLSIDQMIDICRKLELTTVPIWNDFYYIENDIKYYVELSKGKSLINPNVMREGIVIRSYSNSNPYSFKSINPEYLLHQELSNLP